MKLIVKKIWGIFFLTLYNLCGEIISGNFMQIGECHAYEKSAKLSVVKTTLWWS
jgi:hypothetical protein